MESERGSLAVLPELPPGGPHPCSGFCPQALPGVWAGRGGWALRLAGRGRSGPKERVAPREAWCVASVPVWLPCGMLTRNREAGAARAAAGALLRDPLSEQD